MRSSPPTWSVRPATGSGRDVRLAAALRRGLADRCCHGRCHGPWALAKEWPLSTRKAFRCTEEDSNLHPVIPDQTLNLVTRVSYQSGSHQIVRIVPDTDASDDLDVAADVATGPDVGGGRRGICATRCPDPATYSARRPPLPRPPAGWSCRPACGRRRSPRSRPRRARRTWCPWRCGPGRARGRRP
jgi:hypothetical protein